MRPNAVDRCTFRHGMMMMMMMREESRDGCGRASKTRDSFQLVPTQVERGEAGKVREQRRRPRGIGRGWRTGRGPRATSTMTSST